MNHLSLGSPYADVTIHWNQEGRITRVDLTAASPSVRSGGLTTTRSTKKAPYKWTAIWRQAMPVTLARVIESVQNYLENGEPILPFDPICLDRSAWTPFQVAVYGITTEIPLGETRNYAWVAKKAGSPLAARAVGQALRRNPVPLIVPCHRVVGASPGELGGFMGVDDPRQPEMNLKRRLIEWEDRYRNPPLFDCGLMVS